MKVIVILGPTGIGKTKLSIELAKKLNGEIINADSTQVYQGLDIATAKVKKEEKEGIPHHLFDIKTLEDDYSIYDYQKDARKAIEEITSRGYLPIMVGGSGLYIKAALYDYTLEEETKQNESNLPTEVLYQELLQKDPKTMIHPNNRKRILRALQYIEATGLPFSQKEKTNTLLYDAIFIGLTCDRKTLYQRIDQRVDQMVEEGLLEEARNLYEKNIRTKAVLTPIGYKELFAYFEGTISLEEALQRQKQKSRNYAKRQYTWFRNQLPVTWIPVSFDHFEKTIEEALRLIQKNEN